MSPHTTPLKALWCKSLQYATPAMCLPPDTAKGPLMQEHTACMTRNAFHAPDTAKGTLIQGTKKYNTEHNVPAPDSAKGTLMQGHTIHHTCQVSLHQTPIRVPWCKNTRHTYNKRPKHQTLLKTPWCKKHTIYHTEQTSWCKNIQYTTPAMCPSTRYREGHLDVRTHSMHDKRCVPRSRHR